MGFHHEQEKLILSKKKKKEERKTLNGRIRRGEGLDPQRSGNRAALIISAVGMNRQFLD